MTTKIEGFKIGDYGFTKFPPNDAPDCATLVIHEGPHEPVYTASEVRAILEHMLDDAVFMNGRYHDRFDKIMHIAKTHGITLDPA